MEWKKIWMNNVVDKTWLRRRRKNLQKKNGKKTHKVLKKHSGNIYTNQTKINNKQTRRKT